MYSINFKLERCIVFIIVIVFLATALFLTYNLWNPGKKIIDGSHDLKSNGIWLQHGWIGDNEWFRRNNKEKLIPSFRNIQHIRELASMLKKHHIKDVFPHLCPTWPDGTIQAIDEQQTMLFLKEFSEFRVIPWVGGVAGVQVFIENQKWRETFVRSVCALLNTYPQLAGIHLNIEPCRSGNKTFLLLLQQIRRALPDGKLLSVAAYPPPTLWHPFPDVHWDKEYFIEVSKSTDQVVVMMYDTALHFGKVYQYIMASWTKEVLLWSKKASVLLGVPTYDDEGVGYHTPKVENIDNALLGIHAGLASFKSLPASYKGVALYCEWEMDLSEWCYFRENFLSVQ